LLTTGSSAGGSAAVQAYAGATIGVAIKFMAILNMLQSIFPVNDINAAEQAKSTTAGAADGGRITPKNFDNTISNWHETNSYSPIENWESFFWDSFDPLSKKILEEFVKSNFCPTCSTGELQTYTGKLFELAWHRFALTLPTIALRNYRPNSEASNGSYRSAPRTTVPDGISDSLYIEDYGVIGHIPNGSYYEVKAKSGAIYNSTSDGQIEGHITGLKKSHPLAREGDLFLHIIVTADTRISASVKATAKANGVTLVHWYATYKINELGQMVIKFNRVRPYPQRFFDYADSYDFEVILSY
jgi:hypothetical protein